MASVWTHSPYKDATLVIHLALADFANDDGVCYAHYGTLAAKARCSRETVRKALARMVEDGILDVLAEPKRGRGSPPGRYQLKCQDVWHLDHSNAKSVDVNTKSARITPYKETVSKQNPPSPSADGAELTVNQRSVRIAQGFYDWVTEQNGRPPSSWKIPQLIKMLQPFLENGWDDADIKYALVSLHGARQPLVAQVIERWLDGREQLAGRGKQSALSIIADSAYPTSLTDIEPLEIKP
jgi:hypothetical protein